ncbi:hypothetical protein [Haladaptatus halobius]|uniref:hypothetical protein n=1 Tax=Haladaptatus halobius TaxID=2884875 RepID=UPI001D0B85AF|nr:hypothetical protein [Haladaptatus halobius]
MTRVSQDTVLEHWLELERRKADTPSFDTESLSEREMIDRLLRLKPGAASFVWRDAPIEWHRLTLSRRAFERLRVVAGPDELLWRALSPDGTILGAARRIQDGDPDDLTAETGVAVGRILSIRDDPPDEPIVLVDRRDCAPPRVADGNYRATARALTLLETDEYDPVRAYLAVCPRPVLEPLRRRLCDAVRRLLGRRTW